MTKAEIDDIFGEFEIDEDYMIKTKDVIGLGTLAFSRVAVSCTDSLTLDGLFFLVFLLARAKFPSLELTFARTGAVVAASRMSGLTQFAQVLGLRGRQGRYGGDEEAQHRD